VFVSSLPGAPTCSEASGVVTCDLGTAPPGSWTAVKIDAQVPSGTTGVLTNTAEVTLVEEDPVPANNSEVETTGVVDDIVHVHSGGFETGDFGDWSAVSGG
jgi:hypothetical protein